MASISVHGGPSDGPASADVTETDDPAVQAQVAGRQAQDTAALLAEERRLRRSAEEERDAALEALRNERQDRDAETERRNADDKAAGELDRATAEQSTTKAKTTKRGTTAANDSQ